MDSCYIGYSKEPKEEHALIHVMNTYTNVVVIANVLVHECQYYIKLEYQPNIDIWWVCKGGENPCIPKLLFGSIAAHLSKGKAINLPCITMVGWTPMYGKQAHVHVLARRLAFFTMLISYESIPF